MYKYALIAALACSVAGCQSTAPMVQRSTPASACDASQLQHIVGMKAKAAFEVMNGQPKSVQDMTIYSGSSEKPSMLPKGTLVLEHSTPNVVDAVMNGGTVTKVYCNN